MAGDGHVVLFEPERLARCDRDLHGDEVDTGDRLGGRVLHLEAGVHLEIEELTVLVEELDGARSDVVAPCATFTAASPMAAMVAGAIPGAGASSIELLMPPLGRAVAGSEVDAIAEGVGHHLHLDVAGFGEVALHVELVPSEIGQRLAPGGLDGGLDFTVASDDLHASATAAVGGLDRNRVAELGTEGVHLGRVGDQIGGTGHAGHADPLGRLAGGDLVAHHLDRLGPRADEGDAPLGDRSCEVGILGEEPIAGVDTVGSRRLDGVEDCLGVQVALGGGSAAQRVGLVGQTHVQRVSVEIGVDRHRTDAQVTAGPDDTNGDFATVGDQDLVEHAIWWQMRGTP